MNKLTTFSTKLSTNCSIGLFTLASLTGSLLLDNNESDKQNETNITPHYYSFPWESNYKNGFSISTLNIDMDQDKYRFNVIKSMSEKLLSESRDISKEIVDIVDEKFWDLM